ncbi:hypothetical protein GUITHDRAFT_101402 [Guillardia theta CCMP2712]|uniref:Uncharacterized protein n=1 Tax=Guillardia theta (strain CCMP2712) TaxID=905079 RepID=L1JXK8_GUITC|nr:hypothetical protein GUITHDRAFT_101402 [Guillardia theta CCMP2712]EKX52950.1 hypothetical protein GUITHDRAFT_101402 [Guillardia theta CCMP2712]|eukprot:XP_005839930.1 hypothetical protein GUITHDRAFT_101402 [Guillardia theta CCMP2712]
MSNGPISPMSPVGREEHVDQQHLAESRSSWQSGMTTKIPTPREIGWGKYKDTKLDATAQRIQSFDSSRFSRDSLHGSQSKNDILQMTKRVRTLEVQNLFMPNDENAPQSNRSELSSRFHRKTIMPNPDNAGSKFSVEGWGPASKVEFEDYPVSLFSPDVSSLLTSRIIPDKSAASPVSGASQRSLELEVHGERLMKESEHHAQKIEAMKGMKTLSSRQVANLHYHLYKRGSMADAIKDLKKGSSLSSKDTSPSNYRRSFSPVDFSFLVTTKVGRLEGPSQSLGITHAAGLPSPLRYNQQAELDGVANSTASSKGFQNAYPFHSSKHVESSLKEIPVPKFAQAVKSSNASSSVFRPSFDKGVELDGQIAPGKRPRDLTINHR